MVYVNGIGEEKECVARRDGLCPELPVDRVNQRSFPEVRGGLLVPETSNATPPQTPVGR